MKNCTDGGSFAPHCSNHCPSKEDQRLRNAQRELELALVQRRTVVAYVAAVVAQAAFAPVAPGPYAILLVISCLITGVAALGVVVPYALDNTTRVRRARWALADAREAQVALLLEDR